MSKAPVTTLIAITGDAGFYRRRAVTAAVEHQQKQGWQVLTADAAVPGSLSEAMFRNPFITGDDRPLLLVVDNPEKADPDFLRDHWKNSDGSIVLMLVFEGNPAGNTKFGKLCADLGKQHRKYEAPKDWEAPDQAAEFCIAEALTRGRVLSRDLADALVERAGSDLGSLSFEILKIATLADIEGVPEITTAHLQGGMAPLASSVPAVRQGLQARNASRLAKALIRLRKNAKDDPTMNVTGVLRPAVTEWLAVSELMSRGVGSDEIAARVKQNPWVLRTKTIPGIRNWTVPGLIQVVRGLAEAERARLNGTVDPWTLLTVRLLEACTG